MPTLDLKSPQTPAKASVDRRYKTLDMAIKRNQDRSDALIEVLHKAQESFGYLEEEVLHYIARKLKLPLSKVYGVASFYHLFSLKPSGLHSCVVCLGTACYVKGSDKILEGLEQKLGIKVGETTADGRVSLLTARCIGACGIAPAIVFDGTVAGKQEPTMALEQIAAWEAE
jgi:bidirectional [NiFe] hydrogenase diaphorase subunit